MNTDSNLEELYEKVVSSTNKPKKILLGTKREKPLKMSEATALLCEEGRKLRKKMTDTPNSKRPIFERTL